MLDVNYIRRLICLVGFLLIGLHGSCALYRQCLSGRWVLISDGPRQVNSSIYIPGDVYSALQLSGVIDDPLYRYNDWQTRWVSLQNFTIMRPVEWEDELLKEDVIELVIDGLDAFANVYLGSNLLGTVQSMFVRSSFEVTDILKTQSENRLNLALAFVSPVTIAKYRVSNDKPLASPPFCPPESFHGDCYVNQLRKQQSSFGWDWGPSLPTSGVYWGVYLLGYTVHIRYINVDTVQLSAVSSSAWNFTMRIWLESSSNVQVYASVRVAQFATFNYTWKIAPGLQSYVVVFQTTVDETQLWWPSGYGAQPLHSANVTVQTMTGVTLDSEDVLFGVRDVQLVQDTLPVGLTFYFSVNGKPIYAKGSNWVPLDALVGTNMTSRNTRIDALLGAVVDANQNMIRVWGGGLYESDYFYEKCDQMGVLVWQDLMFACALYPHPQSRVAATFYTAVEAEVQHQILRLQHHPSIAIWAGNNENEAGLSGNWYDTNGNYSYFYDAYVYLYVNTLRNASLRLDPRRPFVTSSPSNGKESEQEGWVAKNPYDLRYGDIHFYHYSDELWHYEYPRARFVSEYGFQSFAFLESWLLATDPDRDWSWDLTGNSSDVINWREHLTNGLTYLVNSINQHFHWQTAKLPSNTLSIVLQRDASRVTEPQRRFGALVYLSQLEQMEVVAAQTRTYRAASGCKLDASGTGYNMGSMYWQLNDVWHTVSWSSVDYTLRRKPLHYAISRLFQNEIVFFHTQVTEGRNMLKLYYVNEQLIASTEQLCSARTLVAPARRLLLRCHGLDNVVWRSETRYDLANVTLANQFANVVVSAPDSDYLSNCDCSPAAACGLHVLLLDEGETEVISEDYHLFDFPKALDLKRANVVIENVTLVANAGSYFDYAVDLVTDAPALYVCLDSHHIFGHFSHGNCLHLFQKTRRLLFHSAVNVSVDQLRSQLTVTTLTDLQREDAKQSHQNHHQDSALVYRLLTALGKFTNIL